MIELLNLYSFETEDLGEDTLDISLPANRYSDAASHFGINRELGVILNKKFNLPVKLIVNQPELKEFINIQIENKNDCRRYLAYYFEIPKVLESPPEVKKILKSCGINPINNIVDIANLVMLETGQPLHIFDADKLLPNQFPKNIIVRRAKKGEIIETLDNQKFELNPEILVIADNKNPLAIAGIKGGLYSGVTKNTRRIILEAANFDPVLIYKASKFLNLKTDAALRFSHGLSPYLVKIGADRAVEYLKKTGAKLIDSFDTNPKKLTEKLIDFDTRQYEKLIGQKINLKQAKKYFINLGFEVKNISSNVLRIKIPDWRMDLEDFEDLAEEVLRFEGVNNLKPQRPIIELQPYFEDDIFVFKDKIRQILQKLNFSEVYNHSLIGEDDKIIKELNLNFENKLIEVLYPVSRDFKYLRPSLLIWLKKNLLENSRFFKNIFIFEIGKIFYKDKNELKEKLSCALGILTFKELAVFEMKGVVETLFKSLGLTDFLLVEDNKKIRIEVDFKPIGYIYYFKTKKQEHIALAEFDASNLLYILEEENEFRPIPKYPSIVRDLSILVSKDFKIGEIMEEISSQSNLIKDVDLIDEYWAENFG
ncbi:MAG: phenylalanine--tRNA ligase subunit beta, partial [Minisyncoccia bacterium]